MAQLTIAQTVSKDDIRDRGLTLGAPETQGLWFPMPHVPSMWGRSTAVLAFVVMAAFGLASCGFKPLYGSGTKTSSGAALSDAMAAVDVVPIPGRVGQKVRNELIFLNTSGGHPNETRYRLEIALSEKKIDQLVQISGDAKGQVLELQATFKLVDIASGQVLREGAVTSRAAYQRYQEIFSNERARYDAENRAARAVAQTINTQVAAFLAT